MNKSPLISVILPVRNEEEHIESILQQIADQTLVNHKYEILVIDGCSEDNTVEIVEKLIEENSHIRLLNNPNFLSSYARNIGVQNARGTFVLFVDGHCKIRHPEMLEAVEEAALRGEKCISRAQFLIDEDVTPYQQAVALARSSIIGHYSGSQIFRTDECYCNPMSAGCGYDRDLFLELGCVDTSFDAAEDLEFNYRVHQQHIQAFHSGTFEVNYYPRQSFRKLFRQLYRYGYGRARMNRKHRKLISGLSLVNSLMILCLLFLPILSLAFPSLLRLWFMVVSSYVILSCLVSAWQAGTHGRGRGVFLKIWACVHIIHFAAGVGFLSGLLSGPSFSHKPDIHNKTILERS